MNRRSFLHGTAFASGAFTLRSRRVLGANDRVRLGIIGAGGRGQELIKAFTRVPGAELVAVADAFSGRHEEVRALAPNARSFDDHRKLLELKDLDAVIVATPLHCHARHFIDTLAAGKDLYAEKTMTWSIAEAESCRKAAQRQAARVVGIGLQNQSAPGLAQTKRWLADGLLGKVTLVESWMSRNTPRGKGQWKRPIPAACTAGNVRWDAFCAGRRKRAFDPERFINWRLYWEYSGGNVTENMVHQISWLMDALSLPLPLAATMSGGVLSEKDGREVPDTIGVTLEFPDLLITWQSTFGNARFGVGDRILGSHGTVERLMGSTDMVTGKAGTSLRYQPESLNRPDTPPIAAPAEPEVGALHVANFVDCVRTRKQPNATVDIGYRSAIAAHLANIAYRRKQRVTLEEARRSWSHGMEGLG